MESKKSKSTLELLEEIAEKDLKIEDASHLDVVSLKIPILHHEWLKRKNHFEIVLKENEMRFKILFKERWEYYGGKAGPEVYQAKPFGLKILRADLEIYLNADEELQKLKFKIDYQKQIVAYCDQIIRAVQNKSFSVKHAIEFLNYKSGIL